MSETTALSVPNGPATPSEGDLIRLVLDGLTSTHSQRSYRTGLEQFFRFVRAEAELQGSAPAFTKALAGRFRVHLLAQDLSPATINLRISPLRRLAREMSNNQLLDPAVAAAIERTPGVEQRGTRAGNWLTRDQANDLLNAPDPWTLKGKRDRALLALLLGCGLRRGGLIRLELGDLQQREARWVIPDLPGKGGRLRTVTVPAGVKARVDLWVRAAGITAGRLFRAISQTGVVRENGLRDGKAI